MNKKRREKLAQSAALLERVADSISVIAQEESDAIENLPPGIQDSDRAAAMEENVDTLDTVLDLLCEASNAIHGII